MFTMLDRPAGHRPVPERNRLGIAEVERDIEIALRAGILECSSGRETNWPATSRSCFPSLYSE